jgi:hypothetical protein
MQLWKDSCRTTVDAGAFLTASATDESGEVQQRCKERRESVLSKWHTRMVMAMQEQEDKRSRR